MKPTYEQLEQQLAAVVAENAGLKESRKNLAELIHDELNSDYPLNMDVETPATDAYLAEVRASAIEHAASERWGSGYVFDELNEFAAQLRQGAEHE